MHIYWTSITNFYAIPFNIFLKFTKQKEFVSLEMTTFVHVLSSDWW